MNVGTFEAEFDSLKRAHVETSGCFVFDGCSGFCAVAQDHFRNSQHEVECGVYVVRRRDTKEVLYIGKAGTVDGEGNLKNQNLLGRLTNVKGKRDGRDITADEWFQDLLLEKQGPLLIEYVLLEQPKPQAPALVEAVLLQAYLNEHGRLPHRNKQL